VYVLCVSKATTAGINSIREVRWLRADEYSINALNTGTGSMDSTLQHTAQHSVALQGKAGGVCSGGLACSCCLMQSR
jgi:hypothetical protein